MLPFSFSEISIIEKTIESFTLGRIYLVQDEKNKYKKLFEKKTFTLFINYHHHVDVMRTDVHCLNHLDHII